MTYILVSVGFFHCRRGVQNPLLFSLISWTAPAGCGYGIVSPLLRGEGYQRKAQGPRPVLCYVTLSGFFVHPIPGHRIVTAIMVSNGTAILNPLSCRAMVLIGSSGTT